MPLLTDQDIEKAIEQRRLSQIINKGSTADAFDFGARYARNLYEERIREKDKKIKELEELLEIERQHRKTGSPF